ncbi:MAG: DUF4395 domain-containing protein [Bacteroidetes bacterium]|nr:DUF4395 domain-containing protein [Bacteroidota bacterium]
MAKFIQFGEKVEGYEVPVLNEREIRASAGILFLIVFISLMLILFKGNFVPAKFFIFFFLIDFTIRVFINPNFSPSLILGRMIVGNQRPEYVGAPQKKFAWIIGFALSALMFVFMVLLNTYSIVTGLICLVCLIFLFFESAFGICLGCIFYNMIYKEKAKLCPGYVCEPEEKQPIQNITRSQWMLVVAFIAFAVASVYFFRGSFSPRPQNLWLKYGIIKGHTSPGEGAVKVN